MLSWQLDVAAKVAEKKQEFDDVIAQLRNVSPTEWTNKWKFRINGKERSEPIAHTKYLIKRELESKVLVRYVSVDTYQQFFSSNLAGLGATAEEDHDEKWVGVHGATGGVLIILSDGTLVPRPGETSGFKCMSCYFTNGRNDEVKPKVYPGQVSIINKCEVELRTFSMDVISIGGPGDIRY